MKSPHSVRRHAHCEELIPHGQAARTEGPDQTAQISLAESSTGVPHAQISVAESSTGVPHGV